MRLLLDFLRWYKRRRHLRPWALIAPVLVLLVCLPLLKPIRQPDPRHMGDEESAVYGSVQAMVEQHTLAIDDTAFLATRHKVRKGGHYYAQSPPMFSLLLCAPYGVLHHWGLTFRSSPTQVMYLLTLLGVTLPVAAATALIYRMGRLFELSRPWRALLSFVVAFGSGWLSYATVVNPYAPAAALVLSALACMIHVALLRRPTTSGAWLALAGFCAALAAVVDLGAGVFLLLLPAVIPTLRWNRLLRVLGFVLYGVGASVPIALHARLSRPIFGDWQTALVTPITASPVSIDERDQDDESAVAPISHFAQGLGQFVSAMIGRHGVFTHFPVVIVGFLGVSLVMHRHWPGYTKVMAGISVAGMIGVIGLYILIRADWHGDMFANRALVVCLPVTIFWAGMWLRRAHRPVIWGLAGAALAFSCLVTVIGATNPTPRDGYTHYTFYDATRSLFRAEQSTGVSEHVPQREP